MPDFISNGGTLQPAVISAPTNVSPITPPSSGGLAPQVVNNTLSANSPSVLDNFLNYAKSFAGSALGSITDSAGNIISSVIGNIFNSHQAQINRDFQERMSNTSFQRQVADMRAAGVNPALMYARGSSGASTPVGSTASFVSPAINNASNLSALSSESSVNRSESDLNDVKTSFQKLVNGLYDSQTKASINQLDANTRYINAQISRYDALTDAQLYDLYARGTLSYSQMSLVRSQVDQLSKLAALYDAQTQSVKDNNVVLDNIADYIKQHPQLVHMKQVMSAITPIVQSITSLVGAGTSIVTAGKLPGVFRLFGGTTAGFGGAGSYNDDNMYGY